jgi:hypothetical protein
LVARPALSSATGFSIEARHLAARLHLESDDILVDYALPR